MFTTGMLILSFILILLLGLLLVSVFAAWKMGT